jgi:pimeloyl-ACP methyl ester carboxylesterase
MKTATTHDGAHIAFDQGGAGPPLLLVHGTISDRSIWEPVRPLLEKRFTVYAVHRRGREGSAALDDHVDFEREFRDVARVIDEIGQPVHVLGHSFGAHCALGAALHTDAVRSLVLYEPPAPNPELSGAVALFQDLIDRGERAEAVRQFLAVGPGEPEENIDALSGSALWPTMLALAPTIPLDLEALSQYQFEAERFEAIQAPVAYLLGTDSPAHFRVVGDAIAPLLSDFRWVELPNQMHFANVYTPERFVEEIERFLDTVT